MTEVLKGKKVARVATTTFLTLTQLCPQLDAINKAGSKVTIISSQDELSSSFSSLNYSTYKAITIRLEINLLDDSISLFRLWNFFRSNKFDIVHSITPKAGLLCAIAAKLAGVPVRLHTFTGQPWITMQGFKRKLLKFCDRIIGLLNTRCYTDSFSQQDILIQNNICSPDKIIVLGNGSLAGIDLTRFSEDNFSSADKSALRLSLGLNEETNIILFLGRITEEKGVFELISAFKKIKHIENKALLVVGDFENKIEASIRAHAETSSLEKIIFTGYTNKPEQYIAIADVLCLPSYREGFGTVVIEAGAMGVPTIGSRIYGLTDAIIDGVTGVLVEPKNVVQLTELLVSILEDKFLRKTLGENAKNRALKEFDSKHFSELVVNEYSKLLESI